MNEFNKTVLSFDRSGIVESCDCCRRLIFNWDSVGDAATLAPDGVRILCNRCLTAEK